MHLTLIAIVLHFPCTLVDTLLLFKSPNNLKSSGRGASHSQAYLHLDETQKSD